MKQIFIIVITAALMTSCAKKEPETPPAMPTIAVLAKAAKQSIKNTVDVVGSLSARDEVTIVSELDSTVKEVTAKEGQLVKKGEKLFQLDDVKTAALLSEAEAAFELAALSQQRNEGLLKNNTISQQTYDEAQADLKSKKARFDLAKDAQSKTIISAPFDGVIGERSISTGQFITRGQKLLHLVRTDPLDIIGDVPERYTAGLLNGLQVEFSTEAYKDKSFNALVIYVSPTVDPSSRTVRIKAEVPNADGTLKAGMFGKMSIVINENTNSLVIPESCIQMQGSNMMVVRVNKEKLAEMTPVTTGRRSKGMVEIVSGLDENDLVVVEGWQKMGPGSPVITSPKSEKYGVIPEKPTETTNDNI